MLFVKRRWKSCLLPRRKGKRPLALAYGRVICSKCNLFVRMSELQTQEILVDFGKICRLCLTEDGVLFNLYGAESPDKNDFKTTPEKIQELMAIKINDEDGLPQWICQGCLSQVNRCRDFFQMCHNSQLMLIHSYVKALSQAGVSNTAIQEFLADRDIDFLPEPPKTSNYTLLGSENENNDNDTDFDPCDSLIDIKEEIDEKPFEKNNKLEKALKNEKIYCSDCSKIFTHKDKLAIHRISVHHDDLVTETPKVDETSNKITGLWTCEFCGAKFRSKSAITTHIRRQHLKQEKEQTSHYRKLTFCKYCGSSFSRTNFSRHLEVIHRLTKSTDFDQTDVGHFDCRICFRPFVRHSSLRNHIEKYHADNLQDVAEHENCEIVWNCNECDSLFSEEMFLVQHFGSKHSKYPLEVDSLRILKPKNLVCSCGTVNLNSFDAGIHDIFYHLDCLDENSQIECIACEKLFPELNEYKKHLISYHWFVATGFDNECTFCGQEFEKNDILRVHLHDVHDISFEKLASEIKVEKSKKKEGSEEPKKEELIQVLVCEDNKTGIKEEILENPEETPHVCVLCEKSYKSENHLKRHVIEYHNTLSPIKCPLCPKVFPRKMNLHNHYKRKHLKQAKKFVCSYCGQSLKGKVALRSHEDRLHRGVRNFKCSQCPEAFTTRSILRKHEQRHLADRPMLQCQYCERKFSTISGIERHVKTHEGVKEFMCDLPLCGKFFYTKSELKRHIKFHNKDFKHVCKTCNHKFMSPGELKKHSTKHTGERPFKCHLCSCAYARRDDKVKHLKRVHNLKVKRVYGKPLRKYSDEDDKLVDTIVIDEGEEENMSMQENVVIQM